MNRRGFLGSLLAAVGLAKVGNVWSGADPAADAATFDMGPVVPPEDFPGRVVRWHSSDPRVATVSDAGLVTMRGRGSCRVYATCEGVVIAPVRFHVG